MLRAGQARRAEQIGERLVQLLEAVRGRSRQVAENLADVDGAGDVSGGIFFGGAGVNNDRSPGFH